MVTQKVKSEEIKSDKIKPEKTKKRKKFSFENLELYGMIAPSVIYFIIFAYLPMVGLIIAFKNYNYVDGIFGSPWSGFDNFQFLFESGKVWSLAKNTIVYNLAFLVTNIFAEVILAVILSEIVGKRLKKFCQSVMILPNFISWVVVGVFVYNFLNFESGVFNRVLLSMGKEPVHFYAEAGAWPYILVLANLWKGAGYGSIIYLATITGIDTTIYEAAEIDGANVWQRIRHITLPLLTPTIITMSLLSVGRLLRGNFDLFYQLIGNNGMLYESTDIIDTYIFRALLSSPNIGMSSAVGFLQSVLCFVVIVLVNKVVKMYEKDYALF